MSAKIKSTQYPEREPLQWHPFFQDGVPQIIKKHWGDMQEEARKEKMRKVVAHLNSKPISKSDLKLIVFVGLCIGWFIGRALWHWLTV